MAERKRAAAKPAPGGAGEGGDSGNGAAPLRLHRTSWSEHRKAVAEAGSDLLFAHLPLRPRAKPAELLAIPAEERQQKIVFRDEVHEFDIVTTAEQAIAIAEARVARTAAGLYTARELAAAIAALTGDPRLRIFGDVVAAFQGDGPASGGEGTSLLFHEPRLIDDLPGREIPAGWFFKGGSAAYTLDEDGRGKVNAVVRADLAAKWAEACYGIALQPEQPNDGRGASAGAVGETADATSTPGKTPEEEERERQDDRLKRLEEFGGKMVEEGKTFRVFRKTGAFKKLCEAERKAGRSPYSEKSIRDDLKEAAERRRDAEKLKQMAALARSQLGAR